MLAPPSELLQEGDISSVEVPTVRGLASAYIDNTTQLGIVNERLRKIREWVSLQKEVYEGRK